MVNLFAHITFAYLLYLVYGAVFLFLGVSILAKDMKGSDLRLANSLWMLAMFGFLHGTHEWLILGPLIEREHLSFEQFFAARLLALILVLLSFLFLLRFGLSLVPAVSARIDRFVKAVPLILFFLWTVYLWRMGVRSEDFQTNLRFFHHAAVGVRFIFGFPAGMAAAYGLISNSREVRALNQPASRNLFSAGIAFIVYGVFAGLFSSHSDIPLIPVPVEVLRGVSAFVITHFIVKGLNVFDIEMRRKLDQHMRRIVQVEKLSSLGQLAAGIAHEINNPLTNASLGIQTLTAKMQDSCARPEVLEKLAAVERNIDKAAVIARELLQFSRQKESRSRPLDVTTVIESACTLLQYRFNNVELVRDLESVAEVMGDPVKLEQVLINVLSNSLEAMPDGGRITIATRQANGSVKIRITDTGYGIAESHLSRVFDPFFTTKEVGAGTGLGLSISYGIVKQHHGTIELTGAARKGTTVTITLPTEKSGKTDLGTFSRPV